MADTGDVRSFIRTGSPCRVKINQLPDTSALDTMGLKNLFKKGETTGTGSSSYAPSDKTNLDEELGHATNVQTGW